MRRNLPFIGLCSALLVAIGWMGFFLRGVEALTPTGVWKDVDENYYIVFRGTNFVETTYNVSRPFTEVEGGILLYDAAGEPYFVELSENVGGYAVVNLNGSVHTMRRATEHEAANPPLYIWGSPVTGKCIAAYSLKQELNIEYKLRLYEDNVFVSVIDDEETTGKYTVGSDGDILLLTEQGTRADSLHRWDEGAAFGEMLSSLRLTEQWLSPVQLLGYQATGLIKDSDIGTTYNFTADGTCVRMQNSGEETEFLYFMSPSGLITLTDSAGSGVMDYMWYDLDANKVYRYVLGNDDWYTYLNGDTVPDAFSVSPKDKGTEDNNTTMQLVPSEDASEGGTSDKQVLKGSSS